MSKSNINYIVPQNNWLAIVNENIVELSDTQLSEVVKLVLTHKVVIFKKQRMSVDDEVAVCNRIGRCSNMRPYAENGTLKNVVIKDVIIKCGSTTTYSHVPTWHADVPTAPNRKPLHWLYAKKDSTYSRTSWLNTARAYDSLDQSMKDRLRGLKIIIKLNSPHNANGGHPPQEHEFSVLRTNVLGVTEIYYPFLQGAEIVNLDPVNRQEIHKFLVRHLTQDKNIYHHYWADTDLVISDMWGTLHKRDIFHITSGREMHRIALDYSRVLWQDIA